MHLDMPPPLLHPFGRLQCHDLFLTDIRQYRAASARVSTTDRS